MPSTDIRTPTINYQALYDGHAQYAKRRLDGSFEQRQILLEVLDFKIPHLLAQLPPGWQAHSVLEIGCATGELVAHFPLAAPVTRTGSDISAENVAAARRRFPGTDFHHGDFRELAPRRFDAVILSDVLEHVEDDVGFLRDAAHLGTTVLVNLPLECNWLNDRRRYGPQDGSGHLRRYTLAQGLDLFARAGLHVTSWQRVWIHELPVEAKRRALRHELLGQAYSGNPIVQATKTAVDMAARAVPAFGRRLHASTLFAAAETQA
ncbi:class I SAM-dependent methyltransferase [Simplicispira metamorpha]|uniref:Methyltransferase family protein n=1 Tax=Simplicispira metamorpha TaxID=80881 RepID=A0A4R2NAH7_9BURK|nr:class I SAM-dependent methyltransferase [Simplicispira metamorpha]TCP18010.1 methyltransferase family protein [Simplicispira metamorpha]